jgi:hypothetical protein
MGIVGRTALVARAWLMAVGVLLAGLPHFHCRCPNGEEKRMCLGLASKPTNCCCGGSCCSSAQGSDCPCCLRGASGSIEGQPDSPCCRHQSQANSEQAFSGSRLGCGGCARTPAQVEAFGITHIKTVANGDLTPGSFQALPSPVFLSSSSRAAHGPSSWQTDALPPPTDLIIVLEHFII